MTIQEAIDRLEGRRPKLMPMAKFLRQEGDSRCAEAIEVLLDCVKRIACGPLPQSGDCCDCAAWRPVGDEGMGLCNRTPASGITKCAEEGCWMWIDREGIE